MSVESIIRQEAARRHYSRAIQDALVGIAHHESGLDPRSLGDSGTSYGLFQLHRNGGTLGNMSDAQARAYFDPRLNTRFALDHLQGILSNRMTTAQAVDAISRRFERPADPANEISSALAFLRGRGATSSTPFTPTMGGTTLQGAPDTSTGGGVDPQMAAAIQGAKANASLLHLPYIKLPDLGGSMPFQAQVDPSIPAHAVPSPSSMGQAIIAAAKHFLGIQYRWGGEDPKTGFDCSGLTQYVFRKFGVTIPRVAQDQFNAGHPVAHPEPGDLAFFGGPGSIHHVGIYLGNGMMLAAPHTGDVVKIQKLNPDLAGFRRFGR